MTSLNRAAFDNMLLKFEPIYRDNTFQARRSAGSGSVSVHALNAAHGGGRPRALSADACLAMALYYLRTENHLLAPALIFGVVESMVCSQRGPRACDFELNASAFSHLQVSKYTTAGLVVLQAVLDGCPEAAVAWPSDADLTVYADAMKARCPALPYGGALTMDGVFFYGASSGDVRQQNRSYSGARVSANVRVRAGHLSAPASFWFIFSLFNQYM